MPKIEVRTEHHLTAEEAAERLRIFGEQLKQKHGDEVTILKEDWNDQTLDFSLSAKGITIDGQLIAADREATVTCNLPFAAMLFRGRIEKDIQNAVGSALARNT
jgi:hypothetical protein